MFNNTQISKNIVSTHVNAVTGQIVKTYKKSWFKRFHLKSHMAEALLNENPRLKLNDEWQYTDIVVVQMVVCGDMEVLVELITKEDYEKVVEQ